MSARPVSDRDEDSRDNAANKREIVTWCGWEERFSLHRLGLRAWAEQFQASDARGDPKFEGRRGDGGASVKACITSQRPQLRLPRFEWVCRFGSAWQTVRAKHLHVQHLNKLQA